MIINGVLAGLVGITAGTADVSYFEAIIIGAIAGVLVVYSVAFFDKIKIDDPVGATSVHLVCGIWGTLAVGIFGTGSFLTQLIGVVAVGAFTVGFSFVAWTILKVTMGIRVHPEEEEIGLDISEHGMEAYSGFVKESGVSSRRPAVSANTD
jgi:Amt family ammonium transporter